MLTTDILRRMPGVIAYPNPSYGQGDTRRMIVRSTRHMSRLGGGECPMLYFKDGTCGRPELQGHHSSRTGDLIGLDEKPRARNLGDLAHRLQALRQKADPKWRDWNALTRTCGTTHAR